MKKRTDYVIFPPGYELPIAHYGTMRQVKAFLRKNSNVWIFVKKWITTRSNKYSVLISSRYYKHISIN